MSFASSLDTVNNSSSLEKLINQIFASIVSLTVKEQPLQCGTQEVSPLSC